METDTSHQTPDRAGSGKVFLIGAGPGDPGLLTLKAAAVIGGCDAIVYDHLVNPEILAHSRRGAELIYAGKRGGERSIAQSEITTLLIDRAKAGQIVGRVKGGDPFIFGRGGEEALALAAAGVEWEVVPGVSSGVAAAAYAGIPLTHRSCSSSVAFITGHEGVGKEREPVDWRAQASATDTLVIFMCGSTISKIARELIAGGRPGGTPIALVRWGTYRCQELYTGSLLDVAFPEEVGVSGRGSLDRESCATLTFDAPVIAIVGEVVRLADSLPWFKHGARLALGEAIVDEPRGELETSTV